MWAMCSILPTPLPCNLPCTDLRLQGTRCDETALTSLPQSPLPPCPGPCQLQASLPVAAPSLSVLSGSCRAFLVTLPTLDADCVPEAQGEVSTEKAFSETQLAYCRGAPSSILSHTGQLTQPRARTQYHFHPAGSPKLYL